jgi:hypothetical protein
MSLPNATQVEDPASRLPKAKRPNPAADMSPLEREIGHRAHRPHGLTPQEIKLVEEGRSR